MRASVVQRQELERKRQAKQDTVYTIIIVALLPLGYLVVVGLLV